MALVICPLYMYYTRYWSLNPCSVLCYWRSPDGHIHMQKNRNIISLTAHLQSYFFLSSTPAQNLQVKCICYTLRRFFFKFIYRFSTNYSSKYKGLTYTPQYSLILSVPDTVNTHALQDFQTGQLKFSDKRWKLPKKVSRNEVCIHLAVYLPCQEQAFVISALHVIYIHVDILLSTG